MPRGWWKESKRHSLAAKKGWKARLAKLPPVPREKLKERNESRSPRARKVDAEKRASIVLDPSDPRVHSWMNRPNRYDVEGIDTPKTREKEDKKQLERGLNTAQLKKKLPQELKLAFERKPYDPFAVERYLKSIGSEITDVSYQGYDVYLIRTRTGKEKFVRGRELLRIVVEDVGKAKVKSKSKQSKQKSSKAKSKTKLKTKSNWDKYGHLYRYFYDPSIKDEWDARLFWYWIGDTSKNSWEVNIYGWSKEPNTDSVLVREEDVQKHGWSKIKEFLTKVTTKDRKQYVNELIAWMKKDIDRFLKKTKTKSREEVDFEKLQQMAKRDSKELEKLGVNYDELDKVKELAYRIYDKVNERKKITEEDLDALEKGIEKLKQYEKKGILLETKSKATVEKYSKYKSKLEDWQYSAVVNPIDYERMRGRTIKNLSREYREIVEKVYKQAKELRKEQIRKEKEKEKQKKQLKTKITAKKVRKLFKVRVTNKKYEGWTNSMFFPKMGGLYGLMTGVWKERVITEKVYLDPDIPYWLSKELEDSLFRNGFEGGKWDSKSGMILFTREEVKKFNVRGGDIDEERKRAAEEAKKYCKERKRDLEEWLTDTILESLEYAYDWQLEELVEVLK